MHGGRLRSRARAARRRDGRRRAWTLPAASAAAEARERGREGRRRHTVPCAPGGGGRRAAQRAVSEPTQTDRRFLPVPPTPPRRWSICAKEEIPPNKKEKETPRDLKFAQSLNFPAEATEDLGLGMRSG